MRGERQVFDRRESTRPVVVYFEAVDRNRVPTRTYEKNQEFDREDWNCTDAKGRREMVQEAFQEWLNEVFDLDYSIVSDDDYDDDPGEV
jgi:hypothetical protein